MGKAEQRCGQASSVAILRQWNLSRTTVGANSVRPCSGFAVNSELSGRIFCCRTLLLPWVCFFDGRTVFAPTHTSS